VLVILTGATALVKTGAFRLTTNLMPMLSEEA
jgi:hypothetical protein